jgi:CheY-like chemotaxis protein
MPAADAPTVPTPLDRLPVSLGALGVAVAASMPASLKVLLCGLEPTERQLIEGTVRLSQHRAPRLQLIDPLHSADADVVIVDARDGEAMAWAARQLNLADKPVIWIDAAQGPYGHVFEHRPVAWPLLPMMLARALEQHRALRQTIRPPTDALRPSVCHPVLVVENDPAARAELSRLLDRRGARVVEVADAAAAIEAVATNRFAWVLLGLQSDPPGEGPAGFSTCQRIQAAAPSLPIVMLGRQVSAFDRIRAKMIGAAALLTLPFDAARLYHCIDRTATIARQPWAGPRGPGV